MVGKHPTAAHQRCVGRRQQVFGSPHLQTGIGQHRHQGIAGNQPHCTGVVQTNLQALHRRVLIQRQPGGARLGDTGLHDQQLDAARQPQTDNVPRSNTRTDQRRSHLIGLPVQLAITDLALAEDQCHVLRIAPGTGFEQIGQHFLA